MIWLTGCGGMLGREVAALLEARGLAWVGSDREVDLTDGEALEAFARARFEGGLRWIVNCAAWTAVDRAEEEPEAAWRVNAEAPGRLAGLARRLGAGIIHVSTDYVFDGSKAGEYLETDPVRPLGAYGRGKAEGERRVLEDGGRALVVRTAWLYGRHGGNFVSTMLRLFAEREEVAVVDDQHGSPTWARDLAAALLAFGGAGRLEPGIYHYTGSGSTSWYGFAGEIARLALERGLLAREVRLRPIAAADWPAKARRPANSRLSLEKTRSALGGRALRPWREALAEYLDGLAAEREGRS